MTQSKDEIISQLLMLGMKLMSAESAEERDAIHLAAKDTIDSYTQSLQPSPGAADDKITIEHLKTTHKKIFHIRVKGIWESVNDRVAFQRVNKWMTFQREEMDDDSFTWYRTYGGYVRAEPEVASQLEEWYQQHKVDCYGPRVSRLLRDISD